MPFGVWMGLYFALTEPSLEEALRMGLFGGLFFGLFIASVSWIQERRARANPPVLPNEILVREGAAGHADAAGKLYLTDKRLYFEAFPAGGKPVINRSIPIHDIVGLKRKRVSGVFPVLLEVSVKDDKPIFFMTDDVNGWIEATSTVRQQYLDTPRSEDRRLFAEGV